jgi:ATP-binding cassette subfamily B multidrug efflux pump
MIKLSKHLRPFLGLIAAAILLLFIQAMADLALPDYMSDIVNKGIQQGGIEHAVPEAIRESHMEKITIFMSESEKNEAMDSYNLIDKSSKEYSKYVKLYPNIADESVFVLKNVNQPKIEELNPILGKALLTVSGIEKMQAEVKGGFIDLYGKRIPADSDLLSLFKNLSEDQRTQISEQINKKLGDNMIVQAAAGAVKAEYEALGMDTDKIQNRYIVHTGMIMLLISIISAICIVGVGFLGSRTGAGLSRNLRREVFAKVQSFSKAEMDRFSTASLITRTTNDITQIQMLVVIMIRMVFFAPIMGFGGIIRALNKSPSMSWIIAVVCPGNALKLISFNTSFSAPLYLKETFLNSTTPFNSFFNSLGFSGSAISVLVSNTSAIRWAATDALGIIININDIIKNENIICIAYCIKAIMSPNLHA